MKVTDKNLLEYVQVFHSCLETTSRLYLPPESWKELLHVSLLPAKITCYVSTQLGVAIEYMRDADTSFNTVRGSSRIEDLLIQAPSRFRNTGPIMNIAGGGVGLTGVHLSGAFPFRLSSGASSLLLKDTAFEIGEWKREIQYAEVSGNRDLSNWSTGKAESRAKDEVLAASVQLRRASERKISISDYVNNFKTKTVLVLGSYDEDGLRRLQSIVESLLAQGYDPILVKDIPDHPHQNIAQKVVAIGAISRFIVVDDSSMSGHLYEVGLCESNKWVTVLLRANGKGGSWMTAGASYASNVIFELAYDPRFPDVAISEAVSWSEAKLVEMQLRFDSTYPWRI